jgi:hypothetical protein
MVFFPRVSPKSDVCAPDPQILLQREAQNSDVSARVLKTYFRRVSNTRFDAEISDHSVHLMDYDRQTGIGRDVFGCFCSARHNQSRALFAVKELYVNTDGEDKRMKYFREVQLLATFRHQALISLHSCTPFDDENGPAIFTPLVKSSLDQCIDFKHHENALRVETPTQKRMVLLWIASGKQVIHRDIKPAIVLLADAWEVHVANCRLSKFVERRATFSQSIGCAIC